jgi:hypothetical protein
MLLYCTTTVIRSVAILEYRYLVPKSVMAYEGPPYGVDLRKRYLYHTHLFSFMYLFISTTVKLAIQDPLGGKTARPTYFLGVFSVHLLVNL